MNLCVEVDGEQAYFRIILQNARMRMIVNAQKTYDIPIAKISLFNHIKDQFKDEYQKLFVDSYKQSDKFDYIKQVEEFFELVKNHLDVMPEADPIVEAFNLRISDITTVMKDIIKDNSGIPVLM
jgi:Fe-S oxidoreductase